MKFVKADVTETVDPTDESESHSSKAIYSRHDAAVISANDSLKLHIAIVDSANQPIAEQHTEEWGSFCTLSEKPYTKPDALPLKEHLLASREVRHKHKDGPGYIFAQLKGDRRRVKEHVVSLSAVVLDVDDGIFNETFECLESVGWEFLMHTTYSHSEEQERFRVVLPLAGPILPSQLPALFDYLNRMLGGKADVGPGHNAAQLYYLPSCPPDAVDKFRCVRREGRLLDPRELDLEAPGSASASVKRSASEWAKAQVSKVVSEGERTVTITQIAGSCFAQGQSLDAAVAICMEANSQFDPPQELEEVIKTVASTYRTASRRKEHHAKELDEAIMQLNERFAWIDKYSGIFRLEHKDFIKVADFNTALANQKVMQMVDGRLKSVTLAQAWLASPLRREHRNLTLQPGQPAVVDDCVNLFEGWGCEPKPAEVPVFLEFMDYVFAGDSEQRDWLLKWLAYPLQHPGSKLNVAVVVWSARQGVGKSLLGQTIGRIYGSHFRTLTAGELHGRFNDWVKGALFVLGEENTSSDKRVDSDRLKHIITGETIHYEGKFQPVVALQNLMNFMLTSNHPDALYLEGHDRRCFVWEITAEPQPAKFYADFVDWRDKQGGLAAIMQYLLTLDLTGFDPKAHAPITAAKTDMIEMSRTDIERYLRSDVIVEEDDVGKRCEIIDPFEVAVQFSKRSGHKAHGTTVCKALKKLGYDVSKRVKLSEGTRPTLYAIHRGEYWKNQPHEAWKAEFERDGLVSVAHW